VEDEVKSLYKQISQYTLYFDHLEEKDADYIDSLFINSSHGEQKYLRVDRSKLEESMEAWIHIIFEPGLLEPTEYYSEMFSYLFINDLYFSGFDSKKGIMTWNNSD